MARRRFSRIIEAARLYQAVDNYKTWLTSFEQRSQGIGDGTPRPTSQKLYLTPFAIVLPTGCKVKQSATSTAWGIVSSVVGNWVSATPPGDAANILRPDGYKAARVIVRTPGSSKSTPTSAITGMKYLTYGGSSYSFPFGEKTSGTGVVDAFEEIVSEIQVDGDTRVFSLKDEEYKKL